jgi:hypothetical protein
VEHLARRGVERDRHALAMSGTLRRLQHDLDHLSGRLEVRRESSLVAYAGREPALVQDSLERVEDLGPDPQSLGERLRAGRHEHELLEVDPILGVRSSVDDVHQRDRQRASVSAAEPAIQRQACVGRRSLRRGKRAPEDRVRAQPALGLRAVELDQ